MKTLLALILIATIGYAADDRQRIEKLTTLSGKSYEQVKISKVTAVEIRFTHADGIAAVPMTDLPPDMQKLFGYDPVAADFEMINAQEERRKALIEQEHRKAEQEALRIKQQAEHVAIKVIEKNAVKLSLKVENLAADGTAQCKAWGVGYKASNGQKGGGKKTATKKTMSGDLETVEVLTALPVPGEPNSFMGGQSVILHGLSPESAGKQVVMIVYPIGEPKKGVPQHYATSGSIAYSLLNPQPGVASKQ